VSEGGHEFVHVRPVGQIRIRQPDGNALSLFSDLCDWEAVEEGLDGEALPPDVYILYTPRGRRQGFCSAYAEIR
jgi:hypothetical protein